MAPSKSHSRRSKPLDRTTHISKALSLLLRHRADDENIPISPAGFVHVSDALHWHRLRSIGASFEDVLGVVEQNLKPGEKGRFGVRWEGGGGDDQAADTETRTETEQALAAFTTGADTDPSHFLIRAVQGHSLKLEDTSALLSPITMADAPETVVHGTFYGAWGRILKSGGLKSMGRMHVHCATGPGIEEILHRGQANSVVGGEKQVVRSGMRGDAQVYIYVDIKKALEAGVPFWRSQNGVVLTEGVPVGEKGKEEKMLGMEFWSVVVEVKAGLGVIWRAGEGVVKELSSELASRGVPRGKEGEGRRRGDGGRGRGGGGEGRPRLMVERDDMQTEMQ